MGKFDDAVPGVQAQERSVRPITRQSDVIVPALQAAFPSALIATLLVTLLVVAAFGFGLVVPLLIWPALWLVIFCYMTLRRWEQRLAVTDSTLQHRIETAIGVDLDRDGSVGAHAAGVGPGPGERDPVKHMQRLTAPFIRVCFEQGKDGRAATQPKLREAGFSDDEIEELRAALVRQEIAAWVNAGNHKSGLRLLVDYDKAQRLGEKIVWLPNGKMLQE